MPFLGGKQFFFNENQRKERKKQNKQKTNKEGLGPSEVALSKKKPQKKQNKQKEKTQKKTKNELFSYQTMFSFFGGCPKLPFFDNLAQKARTQKTL